MTKNTPEHGQTEFSAQRIEGAIFQGRDSIYEIKIGTKSKIEEFILTIITRYWQYPYILNYHYSGIATSTGRQALLSNRCRNAADNGRIPPRRPPKPPTPPPDSTSSRLKNRSRMFSAPLSSSGGGGGEETKKSFSLLLTTSCCLIFSGEPSAAAAAAAELSLRWSRDSSRRRLPLPARLRSILRVLRRRRWITGLVVGLRDGLPATAHWVAKNLNFCSVAILSPRSNFTRLSFYDLYIRAGLGTVGDFLLERERDLNFGLAIRFFVSFLRLSK